MSTSLANTSNLVAVKTIATFGNLITIYNPATNEVEFLANEVAKLLNYKDAFNMVRILDEDESHTSSREELKKIKDLEIHLGHEVSPRGMTIISESGLFHAIIKSGKPEAIEMRKIITNEILPSIRKTGSYSVNPQPQSQVVGNLTVDQLAAIINDSVKKALPKVEFKNHGVFQPFSGFDVATLVEMLNEKYNIKASVKDGYDLLVLSGYVNHRNRNLPTAYGVRSEIVGCAVTPIVYSDDNVGISRKIVVKSEYANHFVDELYNFVSNRISDNRQLN